MEIIKKSINESIKLPINFDIFSQDLNYALIDIETTGINSEKNKVILVGLLYFEDNQIKTKQLFCNDKNEEKDMLIELISVLKKFDFFINYNGNSFDIPFLNKRFKKSNIDFNLPIYKSFDLYRILKNITHKFNLPNLKLKTVEKYMGICREDRITGKESVKIYNKYVESKDNLLKNIIILHNYEDIYYLYKILLIINKIDFHKVIFENSRIIKFDENLLCYVTKNKINSDSININGFINKNINDNIIYKQGYSLEHHSENNNFVLKIPLYNQSIRKTNLLYLNLNDFELNYKKIINFNNIPEEILITKKNKIINYIEINDFISVLLKNIYLQLF